MSVGFEKIFWNAIVIDLWIAVPHVGGVADNKVCVVEQVFNKARGIFCAG